MYGKEYAYGGHPYNFSGIFELRPRDVEDLGKLFYAITAFFGNAIVFSGTTFCYRDCSLSRFHNSSAGEHFKFKETIVLGTTDFTPPEVEQVIEYLGFSFSTRLWRDW